MTALTRRELVRAGAAGAILMGSGGLLGSDTARAALTQSLAPHAKRGGTLRVGLAGGSPTDDFDMAHINGPSATVRAQTFYETVPFLDGQFRLHDDFLADEFTPNRTADVWTVRLKQGVEFHNGKTATAEDLLFSIKRLLDPKSGATAAGQLTAIDLKRTKALDKRTVRFVLKTPQSFFDYLLSDIVYLVPVGYDPKKPVSTGPWRLKSFQPARQTVLTRFENYHGTPAYADQLVMTELPDDTARVNALISGQVDVINRGEWFCCLTGGARAGCRFRCSECNCPSGCSNPSCYCFTNLPMPCQPRQHSGDQPCTCPAADEPRIGDLAA